MTSFCRHKKMIIPLESLVNRKTHVFMTYIEYDDENTWSKEMRKIHVFRIPAHKIRYITR